MELAIFGSLLVLALAFLVRIGLRFNFQDDLTMRSFRNAMRDAHPRMSRKTQVPSIDYTIMEDHQVPTPGDPFGLSQRTRFTGQTHLVYGSHLFRAQQGKQPGRMVYQINAPDAKPNEPYGQGVVAITSDDLPESPTAKKDHTLADHDAGSGTALKVARTITGHGQFTVDSSTGKATRSGEMMEQVTTTLTADGTGDVFPPVTSKLKQQAAP